MMGPERRERDGEAAAARASGPAADATGRQEDGAEAAPLLTRLELTDLLPDEAGEVVLFNDSRLPSIILRSDRPVIARGRVGAHRTAAGIDVSGYSYVKFEHGPVLYHPPELELLIETGR